MKTRTEITKSLTTVTRFELNPGDLIPVLNTACGGALSVSMVGLVSARIRIFVEVPGGGDWSNEDLEIGERTPLIVEVTTSSEQRDFDHSPEVR